MYVFSCIEGLSLPSFRASITEMRDTRIGTHTLGKENIRNDTKGEAHTQRERDQTSEARRAQTVHRKRPPSARYITHIHKARFFLGTHTEIQTHTFTFSLFCNCRFFILSLTPLFDAFPSHALFCSLPHFIFHHSRTDLHCFKQARPREEKSRCVCAARERGRANEGRKS